MSQMTKRALVASLKELMAEKPLDKITVTDLTEHCGGTGSDSARKRSAAGERERRLKEVSRMLPIRQASRT